MLLASTLVIESAADPAALGALLRSGLADLLARPELVFVLLPAFGGMFDLGRGDDGTDADAGADGNGGDGDGLADESFDDEDDWGEMDEELDDWGEMDGADSGVGELENRLNDLETELSSVSSSMKTVKEENRQLAETVEEADETIRKLLDVYEIVTRGINPFVDDAQAMAAAGQDGSFGLFGDATADEEPMDPDIAAADAESFFDDDFDDFEAEEDVADAESDSAAADGGGASFEDLKAEYDADDGEWEDVADEDESAEADSEEETDSDATDVDPDPAPEEDESSDAELEEALGPDAVPDEEEGPFDEEDPFEEEFDMLEDEPAVEDDGGATDGPIDGATNGHPERSTTGNGHSGAHVSPAAGDAYLATLPDHYGAELVLLKWARYLVSQGGAAGAVDAARHYERLGWISPAVRHRLAAVTTELVDEEAPAEPTALDIDHHRESLAYVSRLAGRPAEGSLLRELGGT